MALFLATARSAFIPARWIRRLTLMVAVACGCAPSGAARVVDDDEVDEEGAEPPAKDANSAAKDGPSGPKDTGAGPAADAGVGPATDAGRSESADASPAADTSDDAAATPPAATTQIQFEPLTHTFTDGMDLKLTADHPEAKIYYTLDDTIPTEASPPYRGPIKLSATTMVRAILVSTKAGKSDVINHSYIKLATDVAAFTSNLPVILLHSRRTRPATKLDWVKQSNVTVFEPDAQTKKTSLLGRPSLNTRAGIRVRGSSSSGLPKKSYKLELWRDGPDDTGGPLPVLGMPSESDWALWAGNEFDRSYIRNSLTYAMSAALGRYAPRTRFVEVFFADQNRTVAMSDYMGAYVLMETIKRDKNRVNIAELADTHVADPEVTGGYIFKIDRLNEGRPGIPDELGFVAGAGPGRVFVEPNYCTNRTPVDGCGLHLPLSFDYPDERVIRTAQRTYLSNLINKMADDIAARRDYSPLIDEPSWIDQNIIQTFTKNPDGFRLSGYFHKTRGGKIVGGPAWDFDRTMGCSSDDRAWNAEWWDTRYEDKARVVDATRFFEYAWYDGLFKYPEFKSRYFKRWREVINGPWAVANLHKMIDDFAAEIGTEVPRRDYTRWVTAPDRVDNVRPRKDENDIMYVGTHADEVAILKRWVKARVEWIDQCLKSSEQGGTDPMSCTGRYKTWPPTGTR